MVPVWRSALAASLGASALLPLTALPTQACLNDRDTIVGEATGLPANTLDAITGRFPRNPPLFYAMRIQRVSAQLRREPRNFNLYDDVAVAYDRIGRDREALQWIEKKRALLPPLSSVKHNPVLREVWYRYYANVGTFRMHQWLHDGANRRNLAPVRQAIGEITRAVHLKPNAHFGREKYQLKLMQWVAKPPKPSESSYLGDYLGLDEYVDGSRSNNLIEAKMPDALQGLGGLIMLGNAWESVDVFHALVVALSASGKPTLGYLASRRVHELIEAGKGSLSPYAKRGAALEGQLMKASPNGAKETPRQLNELYARLSANARQYQTARLAYMLPRLQAGQHPDTDPHFWDAWREPATASLEPSRNTAEWREYLTEAILLGTFLLCMALFLLVTTLFIGRRVAPHWFSKRREPVLPSQP